MNTDPGATFGESESGDLGDRLLRVFTEQALMPAEEFERLRLVPELYPHDFDGSIGL